MKSTETKAVGFETAFSEDQIQERVQMMGKEISKDYGQENVYVIGILEAGFMFMADLVRKITSPVVCNFLKMEMADSQESGHQPVRSIMYGTLGEVEGKHLLLVETMVDSGVTLDHLTQQLALKKPKSLRTAVLINREDRRRVALPLAYVGFTWDGGHLAGYGLGYNGLYRNMPYLGAMKQSTK